MIAGDDRQADAVVARIASVETRTLNAVVAFDEDRFRAQVAASAHVAEPAALAGMPVAVKDNICTVEYPTTCASRILDGYRSPYDATAVARLKAAGGIVACKTNLDEFGMGSSTEHSAFGRTLHPIDAARVPGGSSGGSAALVASGAVDAALGSETGGSVRQPAAFCGVVGVKPTYGRVSRYGLVAFGSSLDQIGVIGRDVATTARLLAIIAGPDPRDTTTARRPPPAPDPPAIALRDVTIGLPREYFPPDLSPAVRTACDHAASVLRAAGAAATDVSLPHTGLAVAAYYVIATAEASANLARFDGVRYGRRARSTDGDIAALYRATRGEGFGAEVRRRLVVGTYVLSAGYYDAYYRKAVAGRRLIAQDFTRAFADGIDVLLTPTTPTPAFRAGEKLADPVAMYQTDAFVCPANLAGVPAVSVPIGRVEGLPVGVQLIGPRFAEETLLAVARVLEASLDPAREAR